MDREDAREIPIIALTADAFGEDARRSMQAGLNILSGKTKRGTVNLLFLSDCRFDTAFDVICSSQESFPSDIISDGEFNDFFDSSQSNRCVEPALPALIKHGIPGYQFLSGCRSSSTELPGKGRICQQTTADHDAIRFRAALEKILYVFRCSEITVVNRMRQTFLHRKLKSVRMNRSGILLPHCSGVDCHMREGIIDKDCQDLRPFFRAFISDTCLNRERYGKRVRKQVIKEKAQI